MIKFPIDFWWGRRMRSLRVEIALGFGVVIVLMLALGASFYLSEQRSAAAIDKLLNSDNRMADLSLRSSLAMYKARDAENELLLSADRLGVAAASERSLPAMQNHLLDMREYLASLRILSSDPKFRDQVDRIEAQTRQYEDGFLAFIEQHGKEGLLSSALALRQGYLDTAVAIESSVEALHTAATKRALQTRSDVERAARFSRWAAIAMIVLATVLGVVVAGIVSQRITGSIAQLIAFSRRVAAGDFSARAPQGRADEFGILASAMNQMAESIENSNALLESSADSLKHQATHDALTGLPNRALLEDRLRQAISYADRYGRLMTVVFINLDGFKRVNDSLGRKAGDELLKVMAERMTQCLRGVDTVVRTGGDEFVIVLYDQPGDGTEVVPALHRLLEAIAQPVDIDGQGVQVTASLGVATYPADGADADALLMNADAAMYRAKASGRNNFQVYAAGMNGAIRDELALREGLRHATARGEFHLVYQPQVEMGSGQVTGVEALIRWQHPERGLVSPVQFIPLAEETGLIVPIGEWVLRTACFQNKAWQDAGLPAFSVSVNVSARQFRERTLIEQVAKALEESGLEARFLELELTESMVMEDLEKALLSMKALQAMGVQFSIDDFGTGYSSLSALKRFPIARLKIDRAFVRDIPGDEEDKAIAKAIISLGHELNLKVIAEGVETEQQLEFLRAHGCDEMQGYLFSRPVLPAELAALVKARSGIAAAGSPSDAHPRRMAAR
ncbi:putative bifunctional diguanylate cyclase/phosphodiesterase [Variovorax paradoxus]|uniref:putative bifunctional diguanylate cyclase/phosphodiesterase n=1 Tax=Variovorax paradoxus TaxID=34073 RepID=UPI00277FA00D|nr:EAL domain-containing protein [Variovorax paradoxus]MDQ0586221.1 diguanylate cyclase (GGDEF)-like protein [Variovorax paradoxus]